MVLFCSAIVAADEPASNVTVIPQEKIMPGPLSLGITMLVDADWPRDGKLRLPTRLANITQAYWMDNSDRKHLTWEYNADATSIAVHLPKMKPQGFTGSIYLETADKSEQFADGRIVLSVRDATISVTSGEKVSAKLKSQGGHHRIDFGEEVEEAVLWEYVATRPGMYDVEVTYANSDASDAEVEFHISESTLSAARANTGGSASYATVNLGRVYLQAVGKIMAASYCKSAAGAPAALSLKAITLRPACEGKPPQQAEDGSITCHARDVTIQGVKVQYEPKPEKNTVGYWVNEKEWIYWDFTVNKAGTYQVEILQGCGAGHGGSEVKLSLAGQVLPFTVEDTGHFQNFKPRSIGTVKLDAGLQRLSVVPVKKATVAVMDLRQVRLVPVAEADKKE